jgi:hypothetical protein
MFVTQEPGLTGTEEAAGAAVVHMLNLMDGCVRSEAQPNQGRWGSEW